MKPSISFLICLTVFAGIAPVVLAPFSSSELAQAQTQTPPAPNFGAVRSLAHVLENMEGLPLSAVRLTAAQQSDATLGPKYRNIPTQLPFYAAFEGDFTPANSDTRLAIFSDDGCNVFLDGVRVLNNLGRGQHLPKLDESLHLLDKELVAGRTYHVRVEYSNTVYGESTDADGATLFAYSSGDNTPPRPDLWVRPLVEDGDTEAEWVGQDVFNANSNGQTVTRATMIGATQRFAVRVDNPAPGTRNFKIALPVAAAGWSVHLFDALDGGSDVTAQAQSEEGWLTPPLDSGLWREMRLEVTANAGAGDSYEAKVRAGEEDLVDQVSCICALQKIAKIQWSYDGQNWNDFTADAPPGIEHLATIGVRAIKSAPDLEWPESRAIGPKWTWQGNEVEGETVWIQGENITGQQGDGVEAELGNSLSQKVRVSPVYDATLSVSRGTVLSGSGPAALKTVTLNAVIVDNENDTPQAGVKVRFRGLTSNGAAAGEIGTSLPADDVAITDAQGIASVVWTSGAEVSEVKLEAMPLDDKGRTVGEGDSTTIRAGKPLVVVNYSDWTQANGAWSRVVVASAWFGNQNVPGRAVTLATAVADHLTPGALAGWGNSAPFDAASGTTDATGNFTTLQRWNPMQAGALPDNYKVDIEASLN